MDQPESIPQIPYNPKPQTSIAGFPVPFDHAAPGNVVRFTIDGQRVAGIVAGRNADRTTVFLQGGGHDVAASRDDWDDLDVCHA